MYVLDSDILSLFQRGHPTVLQRVCARPIVELAITVISAEEQLSGWYTLLRRAKSRDDLARTYQRLATSIEFLSRFQILSFTVEAILRYEELKRMKLGVRAMDLRIGAIALENSAIVVSRNRRDFELIPGLSVEDWAV